MSGINFDITANSTKLAEGTSDAIKQLKALDKAGVEAAGAVDDVGKASDEAAALVKKGTRAIKEHTGETKRATKASDKLADETEKVAKTTKEASRSFENAKKTADGMGGVFGETAGRVENLSAGIGGLIDEVGLVGVAAGTAAVGFLAAAGFVAAVGAAAAKVVELTDAAAESISDLDRFQGALKINAETVDSVRASAAGLEVMRLSIEKVNVELIGGMGPAIREAAALVTALALVSVDGAKVAAQYADILIGLANFALRPMTTATLYAIEAQIALTEWLGGEVPQATKDYVTELKRATLPIESFGETVEDLSISLGDYYEQAQSSIAVAVGQSRANAALAASLEPVSDGLAAVTTSTQAATGAAAETVAAYAAIPETISESNESIRESMESYNAEMLKADLATTEAKKFNLQEWGEANKQQMQGIADAAMTMYGAIMGAADELLARRLENIDKEQAASKAAIDRDAEMFLKHGESMTQAERDQLFERVAANKKAMAEREKERRKAALAAFRVDKAAALVDIGIKTAQSVMAALVIPPPAGPILAAVNLAAGATSAGLVASKAPPAFRVGGMVPEDAPRLPGGLRDQRLIAAEPGELVLNQEQQMALGGSRQPDIYVMDAGALYAVATRKATREERAAVTRSTEVGV